MYSVTAEQLHMWDCYYYFHGLFFWYLKKKASVLYKKDYVLALTNLYLSC